MSARLPTFFVGGVPKAGTTSLHRYLAQHPQIYMSPIKEPTYFAAADLLTKERFRRRQADDRKALDAFLAAPRQSGAPLYVTEWDDYLKLFRHARDETAIGESSAGYFWLPCAAGAIHARLPDTRFIFVLRDPAERLFSWYLLSLANRPRQTFRAWFLEELKPPAERWSAVDGGRYATHLERFLRFFPADRIRIHLYDDLRRDTRSVLRDVLAFVGVDPNYPIDTSHRHNETLVPRFPRLHRLRATLVGKRVVTAWLPAGVRRTLRRWYHRGRGDFAMQPEDRRLVIEHHREEILRTADLIGRDLSAWLH